MSAKRKYRVDVYNDFDVLLQSREITAENVEVSTDEYVFVTYDKNSGNLRTVAVIDRVANRAIDVTELNHE